jgi:hypothetical protein
MEKLWEYPHKPHIPRSETGRGERSRMTTDESRRSGNPVTRYMQQFVGQQVPGGCELCDAYQTVEQDAEYEDFWMVHVHHDDWCPMLNAERVDGAPD